MKRLTMLLAAVVAMSTIASGPALAGNPGESLPEVDVSIQIIKDDDDVARSLTLRADPLTSVERLHALVPFTESDAPLRSRPYDPDNDSLMASEMDNGVDELADMEDIFPVELAVIPASY